MLNNEKHPPTNPLPDTHRCPDSNRVNKLERLADGITELVAHLDAGTFQLLELICEFDKNEGWSGPGIQSCAHWLNWKCGMSMGPARERVRVARVLPDLPRISAAFRQGRVSYSKVRAMTRVATGKNEKALLQVALGGTASHVETQVRLYRKTKRIEALEEENLRYGHRELSWYIDEDGYWVFKGRFTAEQGALLQKALEAAGDQLFAEQQQVPADVPAEISATVPLDRTTPEPVSQQRADAFARVVDGFLAGVKNDQSGGDRYLVNIHTDIETLQQDGSGAEAEIEDRGHVAQASLSTGIPRSHLLPAETSRRMACDCSIVHWHEDPKGEPLSIGRKSRSIPPAIRRALRRRDQGCRFPGCSCTRFVDAHHIKHWVDGGETSMNNLVLLCRSHHRLVHEAGYGIELTADKGAVFRLPDGKLIPPGSDLRSRGNVARLRWNNREIGLELTPQTSIPQWYGDKMDHGVAVDMLMQCE